MKLNKQELELILERGNKQAKLLFEESKNECHLTCQPVKLLIYYGCEELNASQEIYGFAIELLHQIIEKHCWIGNRYVLSATLIWMSSLHHHNYRAQDMYHLGQRYIADVFQVTEGSIRNNSKKIMNLLELDDFIKRSERIRVAYIKGQSNQERKKEREFRKAARKHNFRRSIQVQKKDVCALCNKKVDLKGTLDVKRELYRTGVFLCSKCLSMFSGKLSWLNGLKKAYGKYRIDKKQLVHELQKELHETTD